MAKISAEQWILIFVAAVAVVGLLLLIAGSMDFSTTISGQAVKVAAKQKITRTTSSDTCTDSDGGRDDYTKGTVRISGNSYIDSCVETTGSLVEYQCDSSSTEGYSTTYISCARGYSCQDGACAVYPPDFSITDVEIEIDDVVNTATVIMTIENTGKTAGAVNTYTVDLEWGYDDGNSATAGEALTSTTTIQPGDSTTIDARISISSKWVDEFLAGSEKDILLQIALDVNDDVEEMDESNNAYSKTISSATGDIHT